VWCAAVGWNRPAYPRKSRGSWGVKVYLGAVVLLSAMRYGLTPTRMARLRELAGASPPTLARWRRWGRKVFASSRYLGG